MKRRENLSVLRKIDAWRWRKERTNVRPAMDGLLAPQSLALAHVARRPTLLGNRILTRREREVLFRVARGETDQQIADRLYLSRKTVSNHVSNILDKLDAANRRDAVVTGYRLGLL